MYKEIHPFFFDAMEQMAVLRNDTNHPVVEFYKPRPSIVLRLDTIRQIREEHVPDGSGSFARIVVSDDYHDDIIVRSEEAEQIKTALLKQESKNETAQELHALTGAVRSLWELLRARLR